MIYSVMKDFCRNVQIRICRTGEIMVNLVFGHQDEKAQNNLLLHLQNQFPAYYDPALYNQSKME